MMQLGVEVFHASMSKMCEGAIMPCVHDFFKSKHRMKPQFWCEILKINILYAETMFNYVLNTLS